ncbi:MAG TPA: TIGR00296 family protein [Methanoregula sp.]|nr:TIGR00296 family protein [Methanoregula sp.]
MDLLTDHEGSLALQSARGTIENAIAGTPKPHLKLTPVFGEKRGVFVTLTKGGCLRGCIGFPYPVIALGEAIEEAAVSAATGDPRFPPVSKSELKELQYEVTVLTPPVALTCPPDDRPAHVVPGRHGLIVRGMGTSGLLLPQVCTDYQWDARTFLEQTCTKAGLPAHLWHSRSVEVLTFEGQIFSDHRTGTV